MVVIEENTITNITYCAIFTCFVTAQLLLPFTVFCLLHIHYCDAFIFSAIRHIYFATRVVFALRRHVMANICCHYILLLPLAVCLLMPLQVMLSAYATDTPPLERHTPRRASWRLSSCLLTTCCFEPIQPTDPNPTNRTVVCVVCVAEPSV